MSGSLRVIEDGKIRVCGLLGDVDLASARALSSEILSGVTPDARGLVLDLTDVRYLDSTGVSMLLEVHRTLDRRRQKLVVVLHPESHLWRLFEITGLPRILRIERALVDAQAVFAA